MVGEELATPGGISTMDRRYDRVALVASLTTTIPTVSATDITPSSRRATPRRDLRARPGSSR
jgi:hypothetical protein